MNNRYRLFGSVGSPYALKLRAILRYRRLPFDWIPASLDWVPDALPKDPVSKAPSAEIAHVRPAVVPVLWFPDEGVYRNDSTLVAYALEECYPKRRAIMPEDPGLAFLYHLLEDMADEWGVKIAFHYRWAHPVDRAFKSRIVVAELLGGGFNEATQIEAARHFAERQVGRMPLVGCTPQNAPLIVATFERVLTIFDRLQETSAFLFGSKPCLADFGWYGQLVSCATDPTPMTIMREMAPGIFQWLQMLEDASGIDGNWVEPDAPLPKPVAELLRLAGEVYLPFLHANAAAIADARTTFAFTALGHRYEQGTFKYQAKCLRWLQDEFDTLQGHARARVERALKETGCWDAFHTPVSDA